MIVDLNKEEVFNDYSGELDEIIANDNTISGADFFLGVSFNGLDLDVSIDYSIDYELNIEEERCSTFFCEILNKDVYVLFNEAYLDGEEFALESETIKDIEEAIKEEIKTN